MRQLKGNILNIKKGIICHQVNCKGVMGAGLALQIKKKWPEVYETYKDCHIGGITTLGRTIIKPIKGHPLYVANLCAQNAYGRKTKIVHTNYKALEACLKSLAEWRVKNEPTMLVYIPYKMSCGLAGGSWTKVLSIIESHIPEAVIMRLGGS